MNSASTDIPAAATFMNKSFGPTGTSGAPFSSMVTPTSGSNVGVYAAPSMVVDRKIGEPECDADSKSEA